MRSLGYPRSRKNGGAQPCGFIARRATNGAPPSEATQPVPSIAWNTPRLLYRIYELRPFSAIPAAIRTAASRLAGLAVPFPAMS